MAGLCTGCPEPGEKTAAGPQVVSDAARAPGKHAKLSPEEIQYPGTRAGLKRLFGDLRTAITAKDEAEIAVLLASLRLPEYPAWFERTFGAELGATLSADYKPHSEEIGVLSKYLAQQFGSGLTKVEVDLSLIHISEPTRRRDSSRMPSSA